MGLRHFPQFILPDGRLKGIRVLTHAVFLLPFQAIPFAEKWDAKWPIKSAESQSGKPAGLDASAAAAAAYSPSAKL